MVDIEGCSRYLREVEDARERLIKIAREVRIRATKAVAKIHGMQDLEARELIEEALKLFDDMKEFKRYPEIYYPITQEAVQELVEAILFHKIVGCIENGDEVSFEVEFDAEPSAFVTGMADVTGELRRYALSKLIEGEIEKAEKAVEFMEDVYDRLISLTSLPDKLVPGLRRKLDVARGGIERTKSDLIAARVSKALGGGNENLGRN